MAYRLERVASRIHEEVSKILFDEFHFGESLVTVTRVAVSPDIQHAAVYVSVFPPGAEETVVQTVQSRVWDIQQLLNKRLRMRPVPRLRFASDAESRRLADVDQAIREVRQTKTPHAKRRRIRKT